MAGTELKDRGKDKIPYQLQQNLRQLAVDLAALAGNKLPTEGAGQARKKVCVGWRRGELSYQAKMRKGNEKFSLPFLRTVNFGEKGQRGNIDIDFNDRAEIKRISLTGTYLSFLGNLFPSDALSCLIPLENLDFADPWGIKLQVSRKRFSLPSFRWGNEEAFLFIKPRDLLFLIGKIRAKLIPS